MSKQRLLPNNDPYSEVNDRYESLGEYERLAEPTDDPPPSGSYAQLWSQSIASADTSSQEDNSERQGGTTYRLDDLHVRPRDAQTQHTFQFQPEQQIQKIIQPSEFQTHQSRTERNERDERTPERSERVSRLQQQLGPSISRAWQPQGHAVKRQSYGFQQQGHAFQAHNQMVRPIDRPDILPNFTDRMSIATKAPPVAKKPKPLAMKQSRRKPAHIMTAAFDVGTGFSGYAFAFNSNRLEIRMNKNWGEGSYLSYKTPTSVLTTRGATGDCVAFGYDAEQMYQECDADNAEYELYRDFKMLLYNEGKLDIDSTMVTSLGGAKRKLIDVWIMTLTYLKDHLLEAIQHSTQSKAVPEQAIGWVLSVPTIWGDKAKSFVRHAAHQAGLIKSVYSDRLTITLEATAAARYCRSTANTSPGAAYQQSDYEEVSLPVGSKFFVADAGAGTLDCTGLEIESPQVLREIMIASGQDLGGNQVNHHFLQHMKLVLSDEFMSTFQSKHPSQWLTFLRAFEQAKSKVTRGGKGMKIQIPHAMYETMETLKQGAHRAFSSHVNEHTDTHGVKESNGILCINQETVEDVIFGPVVLEVTAHIKQHLKKAQVCDVRYVYLVGGFGTCKLLQDSIKEFLNSTGKGYELVTPLECQTAVIKGAVILGHTTCNKTETLIRRSKLTYGVATDSPFDKRMHDPSRAMKVGGETLCKGLFLPFVKKDDEVCRDDPDAHCTMFAAPTYAKATSIVVEFYGLDRRPRDNEVIYANSPGLSQIGSVRVSTDTRHQRIGEVQLKFDFGDEVTVKATDVSSGQQAELLLSLEFTS